MAIRLVEANHRYLREHRGLAYYAVQRAVIAVGTTERLHKLCLITFGRNGSIFVQAPYFRERFGIASKLSLRVRPGTRYTADLTEQGKFASHLVKLTHPPDGRVHFSQDGRVKTELWCPSFQLASDSGQVFELVAHHLEGFQELEPEPKTRDRVVLCYIMERSAQAAVVLTGHWESKMKFHSQGYRRLQPTVGPLATTRDRRGQDAATFFLGQPAGFPLRDHVLAVRCGRAAQMEAPDDTPTLILFGGADPDRHAAGELVPALVFMYPARPAADVVARVGSLDCVRAAPGRAGSKRPEEA